MKSPPTTMTAACLLRRLFLLLLLSAPLLALALAQPAEGENTVPASPRDTAPVAVLTIADAIGPASADYIQRGLAQAHDQGAQLAVLQMDTPGGLDTAMRQIIKDILASPIPVATFVYPSGARAASAGTYILYASHIAAMAPGTNLGAATPVAIGGPGGPPDRPGEREERDDEERRNGGQREEPAGDAMTRKQVEDAVAYIRGLAQMRGRNAEWAERAVREAVSLPADEAAEMNVVDLVATDLLDLLNKIDGLTFTLPQPYGEVTLATAGAALLPIEPDWRNRFLATITNPGVAYILMLLGIYGLLLEFYNPGFLLPGVTGAISLLLALYAFHLLPVSYVGAGLILLGIAFMAAELMMPSFGILGIGGVVAFVIGSVMLMDTSVPGFAIPWSLIIGVTIATVIFLLLVVGMALKARKRPVVAGSEEMMGALGEALVDFDEEGLGWIRVHSESWRAKCPQPIKKGQKVAVIGVRGLELDVQAV